ncbi:MAG: DUF2961 domain-containing protein [Clostridiales bacterium]|nr:DUF2961 domain-containing protein [Clostridiales bacterium]
MKKYTYVDLLERLVCLKDLAIPPEEGEQSGCFSSYDRRSQYQPESRKYIDWGANNDGDGYLYRQSDGVVAFEMDGPGVIWRAWSANPCGGHIRIFLDGSALPVIDMPFRDFFERYDADNTQLWPGNYPQLVPTLSRGKNRFIPISFQKGCKITLAEGWGAFYHFTYTKFAADTQVPTYNAALGREHQMRLREIDRQLAMRGYLHHAGEMMWNSITCEGGEDTIVYEDENPGALTCISVSANDPKELENLILEVCWDGESSPSVLCPLPRFFSCIEESTPFRCLPISKSAKEYSSFWYMPYDRARIVLKNRQSSPITLSFGYHKETLSIQEADSMMRFCALTHGDDFEGLDVSRFQKEGDRWPDWPVLRCKGRGRFCGMHLSVDDRWDESVGEAINWWWGRG